MSYMGAMILFAPIIRSMLATINNIVQVHKNLPSMHS